MRQSGTVKFFNHTRGFGFITPDDGGKDVFLHVSALQKSGLPAVDEGHSSHAGRGGSRRLEPEILVAEPAA